MAIFGLKSRKSHSSVISSVSKHEPPRTSNTDILEAADVVGDSPDFGQVAHSRRATNNTVDSSSSSLRSRNSTSMKKFFGSTRRKGSQSIDAGAPPSHAAKSSDYFGSNNTKRASQISLVNKPTVAATSPPVITPGAIAPSLSSPTGDTSSFAEAVGAGVSGGLASPSSPTGAPRPSELFAGKGVQWNQIDLTSRDLTKPTDAASTNIDMQKFLKERRQWIPTFKDSDNVEEDAVNLPKSLDQFSFGDAPQVAKSSAGGLKSLKDLEDTHKRKAALLEKTPLATTANGTIFEEAATTSPSALAGPSTAPTLPPAPAPPSRNQSFRTSSFVDNSTRKSNSISRKPAPSLGTSTDTAGPATAAAAASRDIPQRRSSVRKDLSELGGVTAAKEPSETVDPAVAAAAATDSTSQAVEPPQPVNGRVDQIKEQAAATEAAPTSSTANGSVRASIDTAGFVTPAESQTHDTQSAAAERLRAAQAGSIQPASAIAGDASHDSAATAGPASAMQTDTPPRPPKNGQRTPSRQSSKDPINASPTKPPSSTFAQVKEQIAQAAPSLQNVVPGTGAATTPAAQQ
ncbi:uncharacterized protein PAN0_018c5663 [Moesziomyces antarcticus]|uniref:Uncharacterized protein n=2 Tax=Pseudozyma antarctica TaxID=84753 RepID=A0A081CL90_PSEA2|nr:uncharacterized protein PAN0_018c5663 [Moesziomyces antarcticus]GAK67436.1 conserved hypothetical protein [Moesziomyces antarcticus]SPO48690.1 uncharacterized protein PSANT_06381 [Moesziomyces antarcticus]